MIKLTRLNQNVVAINPDHIRWAEALPDTTLFLLGGEKILVRESLDELMEKIIEFRQKIRLRSPDDGTMDTITGDPPRTMSVPPPRASNRPPRSASFSPRSGSGGE